MTQPRNPKVLFVIPGEDQGSSMVFARRQADTLREQESVHVECFYLKSRTSPRVLWQEARRFREALSRIQPEVVHAHFGTVTAMFSVLLSGRVPVMITFRGSDLNVVPRTNGMRARLGRVLSQLAALRAARIVCVSRGLRDRLWWRRRRVTVLPSGVDTEKFAPVPRSEARQRLGWPEETKVVLFNAGHDPLNKRLDLAEATIEALGRQAGPIRLEILNGKMEPGHVPLLMNAADCLLVTSDAEGSPTVVQEALSTNLPVVSVVVGDVAERLRDIWPSAVTTRDPRFLASALTTVLNAGQRSNGRSRAGEFCAERIAAELARLYEEIVRETGHRTRHSWSTTRFSLR